MPFTMKLNEYKVNGISYPVPCLIKDSGQSNREEVDILFCDGQWYFDGRDMDSDWTVLLDV